MSTRDTLTGIVRQWAATHDAADDLHEQIADAYRAEVVAERDAEIIAWLVKKAREFRSLGGRRGEWQDEAVSSMASKIARGAVRANNMAGAPTRAEVLRCMADEAGKDTHPGESTQPADFFQPGHGYTHRVGYDFLCVAVTAHPVTGERLAIGWQSEHGVPIAVGINQWNHEYDGAEPPTEAPHPAPCRYPNNPACLCGTTTPKDHA